MLRTWFFICLFCLATRPCFGLEITLRPTVAVNGVDISLGDIADFDTDSELTRALATKTVGQAGQPGQDITLDAAALIQQLAATPDLPADILWSGAATIKVHRNGITVGTEKIQEFLDAYFAGHNAELPKEDVRFVLDKLPVPFVLPAGELKCEVFPSDPDIIGSSRFSMIFTVDGKVRKNISLPGHFEARIAIAAGQLPRGTVLAAQRLAMEIRDITAVKQPCLDPSLLIGKIALKTIKPGAAIELSAVQAPPLVRKGEMVKIVLNKGGISLSTLGIAKADGVKGEIIRVQNTNSNKILQCRVAATGLVEVAL